MFERVKQVDVKREIRDAQCRMNFFDGGSPGNFARALGVLDVHPEQRFDDQMKTAARETPQTRLGLAQHRSGQPARTYDAISAISHLNKIVKGVRGRCTVGIHVTDEISMGREFQPLDQRTAFADGVRKIERGDKWKVRGNFFDDAERVIAAAIEHHHQLEFSGVLVPKISTVFAQHRFDPGFLVVGRNQQQKTGLALADRGHYWMVNSR